jgi:hypothetical protein
MGRLSLATAERQREAKTQSRRTCLDAIDQARYNEIRSLHTCTDEGENTGR